MNKKLLIALCIVLLFVPTYVAVGYYLSVQGAPVELKVVSRMSMTDLDGVTQYFEKKSSKTSDEHTALKDDPLGFFMELNAASRSEDSLPAPLVGTPSFDVSYFSYDREAVYHYYFTDDPSSAYYTDENGDAFRIGSDYASEFLLSEYALSLYPASVVPTMTVSSDVMLPTEMSWRYVNYLGDYTPVECKTTEAVAASTINLVGGNLLLGFDNDPDYLLVTITEGGTTLFSDQYENIGSVNLNEDTTINVVIEAKWYESAERGYGGDAKYSFYAVVTAQPAFYLGETTIDPGEFVVITGKNVPNINDITFTSSPDIGFTPRWVQDGAYVRALVPVACDLPDILAMSGNETADEILPFTFTITASGVTQTINLNVAEKTFRNQTCNITADIIQMKRTAATLTAFEKAMDSTYKSLDAAKYFSGAFEIGVTGNDAMIKTGFGVNRILSATQESYRHPGVDYIVSGNSTACAVNAGKVIYVGEQILSGKIVVIDHGWGLKSTYCHLSSITVKEGDIVATGCELGTCGSSGFTDEIRLHVSLSVFDVPVCPYDLEEYGVIMVDP